MNRLMIKEFFGSRILNILLLFSFIYVYMNLFRYSSLYYTDEIIGKTNVIVFTTHFIVLGMIARRNYIIKNNIHNILIRIDQPHLIDIFIKHLIFECFLIIFVIYLLPIVVNIDNFLDISLYLIYVLLWFFIFIGMELCMLLSTFVHKKAISITLLVIPFIVNVILQLKIMYLIYS